ncbi:hypothetical protein PsAD5_00995 [Pseudovibrio sp. Ad5]|uniref:AAA family ATPase n=1 Tax=Pseudovibrio sp. Ad5 TaxID=989436 RepID=UPI0007AE3EBF|nr:AAA family ATPase [Pseudovibrio sp. Ad5]KZL00812.1 hypothetical protein PsAD5_00995 [Pseudovibrio sp. Ad5]
MSNSPENPILVRELEISNVASFNEPQKIELKRFNFFYGLNGSGKTTVSRLLKNNAAGEFSDCKITLSDPSEVPEYLIYNEDYIQRTFHAEETQKGIFTLDEANKDAVEGIKKAQEEKIPLIADLATENDNLTKKENEITEASKKIESDLYSYKKTFEQDAALKKCMTGFLTPASKFADKIRNSAQSPISIDDVSARILEISHEFRELSDGNQQDKLIYTSSLPTQQNIEIDPIFAKQLAGSKDGYLSDIVEKLSHGDWITEGITKYLDATKDCPFCKRTLSIDLKAQIRAHIDDEYQTQLEALDILKLNYSTFKNDIEQQLLEYEEDLTLKSNTLLQTKVQNLKGLISSNLARISNKCTKPSDVVSLEETSSIINEIILIIKEKNTEHKAFNQKLSNASIEKKNLVSEFWTLLRKLSDAKILQYEEARKSLLKEKDEVAAKVRDLKNKILLKDQQVSTFQKQTKNVEKPRRWINDHLGLLGLSGFYIEEFSKTDNGNAVPFLRLRRKNESSKVFHSLSEGEKTLISFLYFVQSCIGVDDPDRSITLSKRVIVIDDPISSLSFNHVFDVACMVKRFFLVKDNQYGQVLILTHHLYFLHELFQQSFRGKKSVNIQSESNIFRVQKAEKTQITNINQSEIQNNYESYWQTIKDVKNQKASSIILPNAMRNILEHYFGFIKGEDKLQAALEKLSLDNNDVSFSAFNRYVNRESHSDQINHTDAKEVDPEKFLEHFEAVFKATNFHEHYSVMMSDAS